jgi:hypothetical protein
MRLLPSDIAMQRVRRKKVPKLNPTKNFPFSLFLSDGAAHHPLFRLIGCATIFPSAHFTRPSSPLERSK